MQSPTLGHLERPITKKTLNKVPNLFENLPQPQVNWGRKITSEIGRFSIGVTNKATGQTVTVTHVDIALFLQKQRHQARNLLEDYNFSMSVEGGRDSFIKRFAAKVVAEQEREREELGALKELVGRDILPALYELDSFVLKYHSILKETFQKASNGTLVNGDKSITQGHYDRLMVRAQTFLTENEDRQDYILGLTSKEGLKGELEQAIEEAGHFINEVKKLTY